MVNKNMARKARRPRIRRSKPSTKPVLSHRIPAKPPSWNCAKGTCRFCGDPVIENGVVNTRKHWHYDCAMLWLVMNNPTEARKYVHQRDCYTCQHCGYDNRWGTFQVDHIKPLYEANGDATYWQPDNLTLLCVECHQEKTNTDMVRWRARKKLGDSDAPEPEGPL
jgi:hypothetical protein